MKSAYFRHQATKILGALCGTQVKLGLVKLKIFIFLLGLTSYF